MSTSPDISIPHSGQFGLTKWGWRILIGIGRIVLGVVAALLIFLAFRSFMRAQTVALPAVTAMLRSAAPNSHFSTRSDPTRSRLMAARGSSSSGSGIRPPRGRPKPPLRTSPRHGRPWSTTWDLCPKI